MGITRAQIARQLLAEGGKIGNTTFQLARKRSDGKRPGYYGPDAGEGGMESDFGQDTYSTSDVDFGGVSGGSDQQFADTRAAIEARTPKETFAQKFINQIKKLGKYSPTVNIAKGIGGFFRGAFDKLANLRGFNPDGTRRTQAQFEQARRDRINQNRISNILGRDAPFTQMTLDNLAKLGYTGPLEGLLGTTNVTRSATPDDVYPDRVEGIVAQAPQTFRDAMAQLNLERGVPRDQQFLNTLVAEQLSFPYDFMNTGDPYKDNLYAPDGTYKPGNNPLLAERPTNNLLAKVDGPALIQMRRLEKQAGMEPLGGKPMTEGERNALEQLKQMDADPNKIYTAPISIV